MSGARSTGPSPLASPAVLPFSSSGEQGWHYAVLGTILLAFALRIWNLGAQSLWYDEAFSLLMARYAFPEMLKHTALDTMPPLYYWLLRLWGTGVPVDFYPRFLSALSGTLSVALTFVVARFLFETRTGAVAALFAAIAPFQVFYGQEVRMYALLGAWNLLAAYGFLQGWRRNSGWGWALFAVGTVLAMYTHVLGWLPSAALVAWGFVSAWRRWSRLRAPLLALGGALVVYLPWAVVAIGQAQQVLASFWASPPSLVSPFASLYLFFEGPFAGPGLLPITLAVVLLVLGFSLPSILGRKEDAQALGILWAWAALPLLALLAASQVRSVYLERVALGAAFPVYMLLGWVSVRLPTAQAGTAPRWLSATLGVLVLATGLWGLRNWYGDPAMGKPPQREAVAVVRASWRQGEPVLHSSDGSLLPFLLYAPDLPNHLLTGDPEYLARTARARSTYEALGIQATRAEDAIGDARRFFLVVALDHSIEYQKALVQAFDRTYQRLEEEDVAGIAVLVYRQQQ